MLNEPPCPNGCTPRYDTYLGNSESWNDHFASCNLRWRNGEWVHVLKGTDIHFEKATLKMMSLYHHLVNDKPDKKAPPLAEIMAKDTEFIPRLVERLLRNHKEFYELEVGEYPVVEDE